MYAVAYAVASVSKGHNSVRSHVVKYKKGQQLYSIGSMSIIQVETGEYKRLHKLLKINDMTALFEQFDAKTPTHRVEVQTLILHKIDCEYVDPDNIKVSLVNADTTGLVPCKHCLDK